MHGHVMCLSLGACFGDAACKAAWHGRLRVLSGDGLLTQGNDPYHLAAARRPSSGAGIAWHVSRFTPATCTPSSDRQPALPGKQQQHTSMSGVRGHAKVHTHPAQGQSRPEWSQTAACRREPGGSGVSMYEALAVKSICHDSS